VSKEEIVLYNKKLGIETIFSSELETVGKVEGKVIYLNDNFENLEQINKHEVLHFYEDTMQFKKIKEIILNVLKKEELDRLRNEYKSLYFPLYKNEENVDEMIDNEIVIDFIIKDREYSVSIDQIVKDCFEVIVSSSNKTSVNKRYLNISLSKKIDGQYSRLSKWEKLFVLNHYTKGLPNGESKYETIKNDITNELQRLYEYADNAENFIIDYKDNKYLEKEFEGELEAFKARGESEKAQYSLRNKERLLYEMAKKFSETQQAEYKHIVDFIRNTNYEDSFKYLMLNETLTKIYKQEKVNDDIETIISKRETHKSISGHMTLNEVVLDTIYNNVNSYNNFANLYYAGIAIFNNKISDKSTVNIEDLNTYGKGKWIKFNGRSSDPKNYIKNAQDLSALVQETQWCTKSLASTHLEQGDFYVFVDNNNKPHIAVKMNGNEIDEVRGLKNGSAQELEDEYRDVAIEFLSKNKDIKNGKEWLEKEEWNKRLVKWSAKVDNDSLTENDCEYLLEDLFSHYDYKSHGKENSNKEKLLFKVSENEVFLNYLMDSYNCSREEIYIGNLSMRDIRNSDFFPYSVVVGDIYIDNYTNVNMPNLKMVCGKAIFNVCGIKDISKLEKVGGDLEFYRCSIDELDNLKEVHGNLVITHNRIQSLNNLERVHGSLKLDWSNIVSIPKLKSIKGNLELKNSNLKILESLEEVGNNISLIVSYLEELPLLKYIGGNLGCGRKSQLKRLQSLEYIGGSAICEASTVEEMPNLRIICDSAGFSDSKIKDLSSLECIGGEASFPFTSIEELPKLKRIGKWANFACCEIRNLNSLEYVGWAADFRKSNLTSLPSLRRIKGTADFSKTKIEELPNLEEFCDFKNYLPSFKLYLYIMKNFKKDRKNYKFVRKVNKNQR